MHPLLNIATQAARNAGNIIVRSLDRVNYLEITEKGRNDFVSDVDRFAEQEIIKTIHKAYPHHNILAEEGGELTGHNNKEEVTWIIDPLDGTTNFLHGFPQFSVSIGITYQDQLQHGLVYDPLRQEIFTASKGSGAFLNDRRVRVSKQQGLEGALLGTGFPFKKQHYLDTYLATFKALFPYVSDIRRPGSAALDLAYVASGRLDGFWEMDLAPWDIAAGILLIREAGGFVTDFTGGHDCFTTGSVIAGTPSVQKEIYQIIYPLLE
ncbi:inositol monophosphatase family protein [Candidatus Nitrosacidococcus sp. I8]|uniref:inositol monophosphatase family protein n=1 Tax=Candidatus Nitrosacidococcus sp. I8 TaxID=2942908 RepID=UPI002227AB8D|nr:inositol monophosphatase family protein [Candidatus Nitrosacidococcus sp. I8]CAH9019405.1 Inositol-1-monophosphatase [Candidatus Nitrosacidococcus sp. I8]